MKIELEKSPKHELQSSNFNYSEGSRRWRVQRGQKFHHPPVYGRRLRSGAPGHNRGRPEVQGGTDQGWTIRQTPVVGHGRAGKVSDDKLSLDSVK